MNMIGQGINQSYCSLVCQKACHHAGLLLVIQLFLEVNVFVKLLVSVFIKVTHYDSSYKPSS